MSQGRSQRGGLRGGRRGKPSGGPGQSQRGGLRGGDRGKPFGRGEDRVDAANRAAAKAREDARNRELAEAAAAAAAARAAAARREAARIATEEENKRVAEIRKRQAEEAAAARREAARIATEEENKRVAEIRKRQAEEASGAQTRKGTTTTPSALQERVTINRVLDQNPNIFGEDPDPTDYVLQDEGGLTVLRDADTKQRIGSVGEFGDMLPGFASAIGSFFVDPKTTTFTVDPLFARQDQFGALTGGIGSLERRMGGGDGPRQQTTAPPLLPSGEPLEKKEEEKILSGFTGDARGAGSQFISSIPTSGITKLPAATNYMDYLKSAFTPVNLASPFGGTFSSNPIYRAAHGGFIGFMDEPLNIMYPSNGNMVVHDGISGILKKYKEIRSEL